MDDFYAPDLTDLYFALTDANNPLHFLFRNNSDFLVMASYLNQCGFSRRKNQTGVWISVPDPVYSEYTLYYKCPFCGRDASSKEHFCHHCGAKMKME